MTAKDLLYEVARRARHLADTPMGALRKVEAGDSYDGDAARDSRGVIVEGLLLQEFEDAAERLDEAIADASEKPQETPARGRRARR